MNINTRLPFEVADELLQDLCKESRNFGCTCVTFDGDSFQILHIVKCASPSKTVNSILNVHQHGLNASNSS